MKRTLCAAASVLAVCMHNARAQEGPDVRAAAQIQNYFGGAARNSRAEQAALPAGTVWAPQPGTATAGAGAATPAPVTALLDSGPTDEQPRTDPLFGPTAPAVLGQQTPPPAPSAQQAAPVAPPAPQGTPPSSQPGQMSVDVVAAEQALQQTLYAQGVVLLPAGQMQIEPAFTFARNEIYYPSFVAGATPGSVSVASNELRQDAYMGDIAVRAGLPWGTELEVDVPYRYLSNQTNVFVGLQGQSITGVGGGGGMSDVTATFSKTLLTEGTWRPNLIAAVQYSANTGGIVNGFYLGNGYPLVRALLTLTKSVDPIVFVASGAFGKGFQADGYNPGNEYDANLGAFLSASPETTLRMQLEQRYINTGTINGTTFVGSGLTQATFIAGASVIVAPHVLLDVSTGIGLTSDTPKFYLRVSLPITFSVL